MLDDELQHYGTPRHSGRYPWGSGDDPYQRSVSFLGNVHDLRKKGMSDVAIAKGMGMNTKQLREKISLENASARAYEASEAQRLRDKGYSYSAIGRRMNRNESSIRLLLNPVLKERSNATQTNAQIIKEAVEKHLYVDVGAGSEQLLGISATRLNTAVAALRREGYEYFNYMTIPQLGTGKDTTLKILAKPGTTASEVAKNLSKVHMITDCYSEDGGQTARHIEPPKSISSNRVLVRYKEDGGELKDGMVELRRGVEDISLHKAKYAQVRIAVEGTHYIKGMAVHSDDIPEGYDLVFNTNKKKGTPMLGPSDNTVLKPMKPDPENPFGASIKQFDDQLIRAQRHYTDKDGNEQLSALNVVNEEGNWNTWSKNLASQMLSKQNPALAKQQLDLAHSIAKDDLEEIKTLTNPTVRSLLAEKLASQCDSDAVSLKAAPLPGQTTKVILPFPTMSDTEIYAPSYKDGQRVALVRFPHGGTFEIPELMVNNKHAQARETLGSALDAVGISPKVAERLSGADFDGDNVIVIPIDNVKIRTSAPLEGLKNFNPKEQYKHYEGMKRMTSRETQLEMGKVSNLITDMTIKGAPPEDICLAVKHSMVVIDAEKHYLDFKRSAIDNRIAELKTKYQGGPDAGASTIISRASSETTVPQRREKLPSKMTPEELKAYKQGKMIYEETGRTYQKKRELKSGEVRVTEKQYQDFLPKMAKVDDAYDLVSDVSPDKIRRIEKVYADYANSMKALANEARALSRMEVDVPYNPSAKIVYAKEYASLTAQLNLAKKNAPFERQAQIIANAIVRQKKYDNPGMDEEHLKRLKGMELDAARRKVGAKKISVMFSDREWEAINAGAITKTFLRTLLNNADLSRIRSLATPRAHHGMSPGKVSRAKWMLSHRYTQAEVADALGVSVSTLIKSIGIDQF